MTGTIEPLRLAELLCGRLCHDLSSPIGALVGVLEIARDEQPDGEPLSLAEDMAVDLAQRLKLLRAAWGSGVDEMDVAELRGLVECLSASRRVRVDLTGLAPGVMFPGRMARGALNLILLAAECLPGGGTVALSGSPAGAILVTIAGPRAAWPVGFAGWLNDEAAAWQAMTADPRRLQGPLATLLARSLALRLTILLPAGPAADADTAPPLLLSVRGQ